MGSSPDHSAQPASRADRAATAVLGWGLVPGWSTLEVADRVTGEPVTCPFPVTRLHGGRYVVPVLGDEAERVRDVEAAGGYAVLHHGRRQAVRLVEVGADERVPVLRAFLAGTHGAAHLPVTALSPEPAIAEVAARTPVYRVEPA